MLAALADGTIDAIASDHQPRDADDKRLPFAQASPGGAGLATLLAVTLAQVHGGALTLAQAIELLTARPARLLGVRGRAAGEGSGGGSVPVSSGTHLAGGSRTVAGQGAEHAVRWPRAGRTGAGDLEGGAACVRVMFRIVGVWIGRTFSALASGPAD